jgi:hypothetical protein
VFQQGAELQETIMSADNSSTPSRTTGVALQRWVAAAVLAALAGCGSAPEVTVHSSAAKPATAAVADDADLVSAVRDEKGDPSLSLQYELQQRPIPGGDFALRLRFEATQALRGLQVRYEFPAGLVWAGSSPGVRDAALPLGGKLDRTLRLRAEREGVMALRVIVSAEASPAHPVTATFSIPLIVDAPAGVVSRP